MKKSLSVLVVLSIAASSLVSLQPASAVSIGTLYNGTSGDVACTTGFFEILNNVVIENNLNDTCTGSVVIPLGVTSVAGYAFHLLPVTSVSIPEGVTTIGSAAFYTGALTSLTIPNSVVSIGVEAFAIWSSLISYEYCGTTLTSSALTLAGLGSKTKTCTPSFTPPGGPSSVVATATGKTSATVSFGAPASNGGSAVISFTARSIPDGITKTLTQSTGGTFTFDGLQASTAYSFAVIAMNAYGIGVTISNTIQTDSLAVASISALSFVDDGNGISGKIVWAGVNIDSVLYRGPEEFYPGAFNYDAFTSGWDGRLRNLTPGTTYEISIVAFSSDGVGGEKSLTFTTNTAPPLTQTVYDDANGKPIVITRPVLTEEERFAELLQWVDENTYMTGEAEQMSSALLDFVGRKTSANSTRFKLPIPSVLIVVATSLTPKACSVVSATAEVDAGMVTALTTDKCTISYTVMGGSNAPATWERDFVFTYFELKCGAGTYKLKKGVVSDGYNCTGAVTVDATATSIEQRAFGMFNSAITSITLPNSITVIPDYAFDFLTNLAAIELGNAVTSIGTRAFRGNSLVSISLPNSLRTLGVGAFSENWYLTSLTIPIGTTTVGSDLIKYSFSVAKVTIPSTVTDMNPHTFRSSYVQIFDYCGNNASVLKAIFLPYLIRTCTSPALEPSSSATS